MFDFPFIYFPLEETDSLLFTLVLKKSYFQSFMQSI